MLDVDGVNGHVALVSHGENRKFLVAAKIKNHDGRMRQSFALMKLLQTISRNLLLPNNLIDFNCPQHAHNSTKPKIVVQLYSKNIVEYFKR